LFCLMLKHVMMEVTMEEGVDQIARLFFQDGTAQPQALQFAPLLAEMVIESDPRSVMTDLMMELDAHLVAQVLYQAPNA